MMNIKIPLHKNFFYSNILRPYFYNTNFSRNRKGFFSSERLDEFKKSVLNLYLREQDEFLQRRKEHEKRIKEYFNSLLKNGITIEDFYIDLKDEGIFTNGIDKIKEYIKHKLEVKESRKEEIKDVHDQSEFIRILVTCGIHINPALLFYFLHKIIELLRKEIEENRECILPYEKIKIGADYIRINHYYYSPQTYTTFLSLFQSLSNLLYSISENGMDRNQFYLNMKKEMHESYLNIEDIIKRSPAYVTISLLLFNANIWLFMDKSRKMKSVCLDYLNQYISSITEDEMNISKNDIFYLCIVLRLLFHSFSYAEVLNNLNNNNKHFIGSIVLSPHNSEIIVDEEKESVQNITDYLNKHEKYIEDGEAIHIFPFTFSLSSLKNKTIYIMEKPDDYYINDPTPTVLRAYNYWKYFIAYKDKYQLLYLCNKDEYNHIYNDDKKDQILTNYVNKDYLYNFEEKVPIVS